MTRYPRRRLRRLRYHPTIRAALETVHLRLEDFVAPIFVHQRLDEPKEIPAMPGQFQWPVGKVGEYAKRLAGNGIGSVLVFGIPSDKDAAASSAWAEQGIAQQAIAAIKGAASSMLVIADTCLCEYTSHGHCGVLTPQGEGPQEVDNDPTLAALARTALSQARAGADVIAPSAMMDGQVLAIRNALDAGGFDRVPILSYAVKFASSLYGPFRAAAESAPAFGDRRSYQMNPRSPGQVLAEARADLAEGADMLMVKPAGACLDIISMLSRDVDAPLAAYHVSGEYAMIKFAAAAGALDEKQAALEVLSSIKRAGAGWIVSYFSESLAGWLV